LRGPGATLGGPPGHGRRTADLRRCARRHGSAVGSKHDVRDEQLKERVEVTAARGRKEGVDHFLAVLND
jgi:hypothetical protein